MVALKQGSVPDVIANKLDHLLILTSGTEQYLITCTNKKYKFLLTTTLTISDSNYSNHYTSALGRKPVLPAMGTADGRIFFVRLWL